MRTSRLSLRLSIATALLAIAVVAPAPAEAATNACRAESTKSGNTILLATRQAVVFTSKRLKQDVACTYSDKRLVRLGSFVCCQMERYALGGRYLGYAYRLDEADNEVDELGVVDLRTGKRVPHSGNSTATRVDTNGFVRSFYVTPKGTLAWLQSFTDEAAPAPRALAVRTISAGGDTKELDTGKIDRDSLALGSGAKTLFWTKEGTAKSAALE